MAFANPLSIFTTDAADKASADQQAAINAGKAEATAALGSGRDAVTTNYTKALQPYQTNFDAAKVGQDQYSDLLGLNGPEAATAARAKFQYSPQYQDILDQGSQNVLRNASATGTVGSGGTLAALQKQGLIDSAGEWDKYFNRLTPFLGKADTAAAGLGNTYTGMGNALNSSYGTQAGLDYTANTDIGKAKANADLDANRASSQLWGTGMQLAGAVAGGPVGGAMMSGLRSFLPSGSSNANANSFASNPSNLFPGYVGGPNG